MLVDKKIVELSELNEVSIWVVVKIEVDASELVEVSGFAKVVWICEWVEVSVEVKVVEDDVTIVIGEYKVGVLMLLDKKVVELSVFSMLFNVGIEGLSLAKLVELVIWILAKFEVVVSRLVVIFWFVEVDEVWSELVWIWELFEVVNVEIAELDKALGVVIWVVVVVKVELIKFQVDDEEEVVMLVFIEADVEIVVEVGIILVVDGVVIWNVQNDGLSILGEIGLQLTVDKATPFK